MRIMLLIVAALLIVVPAQATVSTYGWENGGTILGAYYPALITATNVTSPVHSGLRSLELTDTSAAETPQAYIAWIQGLVDGDTVTAIFWTYDTTSGSPSSRIWAHWNDVVPADVMGYSGSASGSSTYSGSTGWTNLTTYTWTVAAGSGHTGLVIECRTYNVSGTPGTVWIDDLEVTHPDGTTCTFPEAQTAVQDATWSSIKALYR